MFSQTLPLNYRYIADNPLTKYRPCPALGICDLHPPILNLVSQQVACHLPGEPQWLGHIGRSYSLCPGKERNYCAPPWVKLPQGIRLNLLTLTPTYIMLYFFFGGCENASQYPDEIFHPPSLSDQLWPGLHSNCDEDVPPGRNNSSKVLSMVFF